MNRYNFNDVAPFEATHVGEIIAEALDAKGMKQSDLADITGIYQSNLCNVIKGKRALTPDMALRLEKAIGISANYLMSLQSQYDLDIARAKCKASQANKMATA